MTRMFRTDPDRKITISFGGVCPLRCRHCYTYTKSFSPPPRRSIDDILIALERDRARFDIVCVSGDTDFLLDQDQGVALLECIVRDFPEKSIMFTTRLIPDQSHQINIEGLVRRCSKEGRFIFPCISVVTLDHSNKSESSSKIPSGQCRIEWLNRLASTGAPTFLTLRPTFPFSLVSASEIERIALSVSPAIAAVLGEIFLLDKAGEIESRLEIKMTDRVVRQGKFSFIEQDAVWNKAKLANEINFQRSLFNMRGIPFFMRSMSAVKLAWEKWSTADGKYNNLTDDDFVERSDIFP